ncbi:unnamed protein product [Ceutorhynchus assimilis]|uniref:Uncharacterized protein n=1 Tax=Ceutorhynchus assimilis TaxID=467358 RepID=A0A9N9MKI1_9CUCU|nr:unnamed protein product [Ceutorhynchus assimilis]
MRPSQDAIHITLSLILETVDWYIQKVQFKYLKNLDELKRVDIDSLAVVCRNFGDFAEEDRTIVDYRNKHLRTCTNGKILSVVREMYPEFENKRDVLEFQFQVGVGFSNIYLLLKNPSSLEEIAELHNTNKVKVFLEKMRLAFLGLDKKTKTRQLNPIDNGRFTLHGQGWNAYSRELAKQFHDGDGTPSVLFYKCAHGLKSARFEKLMGDLEAAIAPGRTALFHQIHIGLTFHVN